MKNQTDIINILIKTLSKSEYVVDEKLNKTLLIDDVFSLKESLISKLLDSKKLSKFFFRKIKSNYVFDKILFYQFISNKQLLDDSFTKYKKKIGLSINEFASNFDDVVLEWPYKDCVLEGSQIKEGEIKNEIFWNSIIAKQEVSNLLSPKVLTNFQFYGNAKKKDIINENQVIFGNNLIALHSLKDKFANKIQTIYCDPPYNKGKDTFGYNDKFNHSTWLTFLKNRLEICKKLLKQSGTIWINLDDTENHYAKVLMDEIFGRDNFIANVIWEKKYSPQNNSTFFSDNHDHILVYGKDKNFTQFNGLERTEEADKAYKNPDNDQRGVWKPGDLSVKGNNEKNIYPIETPSGRIVKPTNGRSWVVKKEKFEELVKDNRIWFGPEGKNIPSTKRFLSEVKNSFTPKTIWKYDEVGHNQDANRELSKFYNMEEFTTPKPEKLLKRILTISSNESDWVLDAFAGSGTTAAVALKMKRKFIICEQMNYGKKIIIERLKKVIEGEEGGISIDLKWKGGGSFCSYDLKKLNIKLIEKINKVDNTISLKQIIKDIQNHDYLSIQKDLDSLILSIKETNDNDLEFAKKALIEILDKSQLYLPYSEIEDAKHQINKSDVEINNLFYK